MFEQVHPQKFYMQIARQIKNSIKEGRFVMGDMLPSERILAEQFGASRASIREALSALEMLGLIESKSGKGNIIKADASEGSIDSELLRSLLQGHDPYEIFETRLELEPRLAGLAALRATEEEKKQLHVKYKSLCKLSGQYSAGTETALDELLEEDRMLHLAIGRCSHNSVLITVFSAVNAMMKETHWKVLYKKALQKPVNMESYLKAHESILKAIDQKMDGQVRTEMSKYIKSIQEEIF
ncbi:MULTISPECIES: FadR/GntR family transcriptional regulator [unclassified Oceanispirochaeta]|uniref:FadR/GntR family transcriptional regulator n=1 Tax=unclassified Oceanispirochaeta TaxID=2635722 RepID=UPI000E09BB50|nr:MULTISPECIES: FadR/GntR family transcriptional regulator [unclassified Oceanispirochaeta]MBF9018135.1 FadR family transcriptional regulator [Oceanispirochaeta sp. M2]NPD74599.1 FadR family transcriptional regulator [Oceanispirochaeta sp. M1]RDG29551.1 FadR family transcriptional regulator [Oceanispirochaeta sp. M1]